jgi:outer membrane protein assembly factor BamB
MKDLGGSTPGWGFSESVLVDGDRVLCTPGGSQGAVAALDKTTGKLLWQSKEFTDAAQYASIVPAEIHGKRQYVQLTMKSLAGIAAEDGKLLWKSPWPGQTAVVPTPIVRGDLIYITSGYGVGSKLVHVSEKLSASDRWSNKVMKNHHGGVILVGEHVYGHSDGAGWVCQDFKSGEMVWSERRKLGKGAVACAGGRLYCLDESDGTVVLIEASPESWKEHGRFRLDPQSEVRSSRGRIWTHPVISSGRLYLRDQDLVYCYDVREG